MTRHRVAVAAPPRSTCGSASDLRRDDGYHPLATVYQAIGLYDEVTVREADAWSVSVEPRRRPGLPGAPLDESNIAVRAGRLLSAPPRRATCGARSSSTRGSRWPAGWPAAAPTPPPRWWRCDRLWDLNTSDEELLRARRRARQRRAVRAGRRHRHRHRSRGGRRAGRRPAAPGGGSSFPTRPACPPPRSTGSSTGSTPRPSLTPTISGCTTWRRILRSRDSVLLGRNLDERPAAGRSQPATRPGAADLDLFEAPRLPVAVAAPGRRSSCLVETQEHALDVRSACWTGATATSAVATGPVAGAHVVELRLMANLVSLERVSKSYGVRILLDDVSLGVGDTDRIGVVGRNGDGKTTLLNLIAGREEPDTGRIARTRGLQVGYLDQRDELDDSHTVREVVLGGKRRPRVGRRRRRRVRWWRSCWPASRWTASSHGLSGGERRRCSLARLLLGAARPDDPRRADQPPRRRGRGLARRSTCRPVVPPWSWSPTTAGSSTRCATTTWEVHPAANGAGSSTCTTAATRRSCWPRRSAQRQAASSEQRRQNLVRKELAWLRRGPPARTSKPKFRIDAANALIDDVPAAARPARAAAVRHPAARQGRARPGATSTWCAASARC